MTIYRGEGGTGSATSDADTTLYQDFLDQTEAARDAAAVSATNASTSASTAATQASNASSSASAAAASASTASTKASEASASASSASASASAAAGYAASINPADLMHLSGTETATGNKTFSGSVTLSGGTANAVPYLNGSKVLTSGSALTFDGTVLNASAGTPIIKATASTVGALYGFEFNGGALDAYIKAQPNNAELRIASGRSAGWGGFTSFFIDTAEQMRLTSTGLGIGTSSPYWKLSVSDGTVNGGMIPNGGNLYFGTKSNHPVLFRTNDTDRLTLDTSGNLGLGVTPSAWGSIFKAQQIGNYGAFIAGRTDSINQVHVGVNAWYNGTNWIYRDSAIASRYYQYNGQHIWDTAPSGTAGNAITFTQAMTLDASGNWGLGTNSPTDTNGYSRAMDIQGVSGAAAYFRDSGDTTKYTLVGFAGDGSDSAIVGAWGTGTVLRLFSAGSERARIDSSGNFGLGVTPKAWGSSQTAMDVGSAYGLNASSTGGASFSLSQNAYYNGTNWIYKNNNPAARYDQNSGVHAWHVASSGLGGNAITFTQAMTLDASGNLSLAGGYYSANRGSASTAYRVGISLEGNGSTTDHVSPAIAFSGNNVNAAIWSSRAGGGYGGNLIFATQGLSVGDPTERARIDSSGNLLITSTGGLGYGTGSGGAVTQITSRTTGVTLNKTNGAITLFSAAGSATAATFTVTNSTVAATDVVQVCQKSGTNLYVTLVTAVAAGSFNVTFYTTGGTATDAPVFNFTVIKAVTA